MIKALYKLLLPAVLMLTATALGQKSLAVIVDVAKSSWPDSQLESTIRSEIAAANGFQISEPSIVVRLREEIGDEFDKDRVAAAGLKCDQRFVLWCRIVEEQLRVEKAFAFPILFKQRRVTARLTVEYRIVDCYRGRIVGGDRLVVKQHGPSSLQIADFTDADPNLYLSYTERKDLFDRLEQKAVAAIVGETQTLAQLR